MGLFSSNETKPSLVATTCGKVKVPRGLLVSWAGGVARMQEEGLPNVMDVIVDIEVAQLNVHLRCRPVTRCWAGCW